MIDVSCQKWATKGVGDSFWMLVINLIFVVSVFSILASDSKIKKICHQH